MGLLTYLVVKGVATASTKAIIGAAAGATVSVIDAAAKASSNKPDSVVKNGILYIKPTRSSEEYTNQDAVSVANELIGSGFQYVELKPCKSLHASGKKKYGKVKSVAINGKTDFLGLKKVPSTSYVVVEYLDFKDSADPSVYNFVEEIIPGVMQNFVNQDQNDTAYICSGDEGYCSECGAKITRSDAKFCSICGSKIQ